MKTYYQNAFIFLLVTFILAGCLVPAAAETIPTTAPFGVQPGKECLVPTGQVLTPAGHQMTFYGRPTAMALSPDEKTLAVAVNNAVLLVDAASAQVVQSLKVQRGNSFWGLLWMPKGNRIYASSVSGVLQYWDRDAKGKFGELNTIKLPSGKAGNPLPCGLALSPDAKTLYAALNRSNTLAEVDIATGKVLRQIPTGVAPFDVVLTSAGRAYVSNWGGRTPRKGDMSANTSGTQAVIDPKTAIASTGTVSVVNLAQAKAIKSISVGLHPSVMTFNRDTQRLFVANSNDDTVSVIDTSRDKVVATLHVHPPYKTLFGSAPTALALSPDGKRLYVTNGGNNAVAVFELSRKASGQRKGPGHNKRLGFIPTAWYPDAICVNSKTGELYVANLKGLGSIHTFRGPNKYNSHWYEGTISFIKPPADAELDVWSRQVEVNEQRCLEYAIPARMPFKGQPQLVPVPIKPGQQSVFKHVIYVIRENRTYDQILGDMPEGNGAPALVEFGEAITPNAHKLSRQFQLLDNYNCSGVLSADGHQWCDEAYATDYLERAFGGFPRSYPDWGNDALAYAKSGFIWDNALRWHKTFRDYGEFTDTRVVPHGTWKEIWDDYQAGTHKFTLQVIPGVHTLAPYIRQGFPWWPLRVSDQQRLDIFLSDFRQAEQTGNLPDFIMMTLPCDHTSGTSPGMPTPQASVADNDLALGRLVEAVSHSRFWPDTVILVTEDDPQSGLDHVSPYRTVGFVISAYTKRGVNHTRHTQVDMIRTLELILGLPPMNQLDAAASPMTDCFEDHLVRGPYTAVKPALPLDTLNPRLSALAGPQLFWAKASLAQDLSGPDLIDDDVFNQIIWHATRGYDTPYPAQYAGVDEDD